MGLLVMVLVSSGLCCPPGCQDPAGLRMEYLLNHTPATVALLVLKPLYPQAKYTRHPTMNGFYANGSKADLLSIKRALSIIDPSFGLP